MGGALASLGYPATPSVSPAPSTAAGATGGSALASLGYSPTAVAPVAPPTSAISALTPSETASIDASLNPAPKTGALATLARGAEQTLLSPISTGIRSLFNGLQRVGNAPLEAQRQGLAAMGLQPQAAPTPQQGKGGGLLGLWGDVSSLLNGGGMAGTPTQNAQQGALLQGAAKAAPAVGHGAANLLALLSQAGNGSGMATAPTNAGQARVAAATLRGLGKGLTEPVTQAPTGADIFAQASGGQAPRMADVALGGADAIATNPASYIPIADVARFLRIPQAASALTSLVGKGVDRAALASPTVDTAVNTLRTLGQGARGLVNRFVGLTPAQQGHIMQMEGKNIADEQQAVQLAHDTLAGKGAPVDEELLHAIERAPGYEHALSGSPLEKITTRAGQLGVDLPAELANAYATTGKAPLNAAAGVKALGDAIGQRINESTAEENTLGQEVDRLGELRATATGDAAHQAEMQLEDAQQRFRWALQRTQQLRDMLGQLGPAASEEAGGANAAHMATLTAEHPAQNATLQALANPLLKQQRQTTADLLSRGLIDKARPGYMMHVLEDRLVNPEARPVSVNRSRPMAAYTPQSKARTVEGTTKEINDQFANSRTWAAKRGIDSLGNFFTPSAHRSFLMGELAARRAINMHDMIEALTAGARKVAPEALPSFFDGNPQGIAKLNRQDLPFNLPRGTAAYTPETLRFYRALLADPRAAEMGLDVAPEDLRPGVGVSGQTPAYVMPQALGDYLNGLTRPNYVKSQGLRDLDKAAEAVRSAQLRVMLSNPIVHSGHNVPWQTYIHDPGAVGEAFHMLTEPGGWERLQRAPEAGSWYERATKAGAISHVAPPHMMGQGLAGRVETAANEAQFTPKQKAIRALLDFSHNATFVPEKAARIALFKRAIERGMNDRQAAQMVNGALGNARDLTVAERGIQRYALPFYAYEKAALTSNARQLLNATPRFTIPYEAYNALNVATSGHSLTNNPQGKTLDIEAAGPNGEQRFFDPYLPALELAKLGEEGVPQFAGARLGATVQVPLEMGLQTTSLGAPPQDAYPLFKYPYLQTAYGGQYASANDVPALGAYGPRIDPRVALAVQALSGPARYGGVYGGGTTAQVLAQLLGAYTSTRAPGSTDKEAKYQATQAATELRSARKAGALR